MSVLKNKNQPGCKIWKWTTFKFLREIFVNPPLPFHRLWTVVLQVDMLEQRSAEKERALQNEVVGSTGGGVLDTPKWRHGDEAGDEERERFKRLFLGGRGVMCEIFGGVAFCENMSFPFSDFIEVSHG